MKIYNEVVIDMNTGETIYEDSFEYSGDVDLCCSPDMGRKMTPEEAAEYKANTDAAIAAQREYGLGSLKKEDFFETDGKTPKKINDILALIKQHKPMPDDYKDGEENRQAEWDKMLKSQIEVMMPKLEALSTAETGFLDTQSGIEQTERNLAIDKGKDVYNLGKDAAERARGAATDAYGVALDTYGAAGDTEAAAQEAYTLGGSSAERAKGAAEEALTLGLSAADRARGAASDVYGAAGEARLLGESARERGLGAAGDVYGAAREASELGLSAAERSKDAALGQLQSQASKAGAQMQQAYGSGMGTGMRGAIAGQKDIAKGAESTYGAYADTKTSIAGALGRAESAYGRAEGVYADTGTALKGAYGRAESAYGRAEGVYEDTQTALKGAYGRAEGLYADTQTALEGAKGRAESAYGRAGTALERAKGADTRATGAYQDELTRLGQEKGYGESMYGVGGIDERRSDLAYDKAMYGLKEEQAAGFESDVGTWLSGLPQAKKGGRVPSKQTFLDVLSRIPDAGGS